MLMVQDSWPDGGIGRRTGLKIPYRVIGVRVRPPLRPLVFGEGETSVSRDVLDFSQRLADWLTFSILLA